MGGIPPCLEDSDVIGPLEGRGIGTVAVIHHAAELVDARISTHLHPAAHPLQEAGEKTRAVPEKPGDDLNRVGPGKEGLQGSLRAIYAPGRRQ